MFSFPRRSHRVARATAVVAGPLAALAACASPALASPPPSVTVSPSSAQFGTVTVGQSSAPETFTVTNTSQQSLNIGQAAIWATDPSTGQQVPAAGYTLDQDNCSNQPIAGGASCTIVVQFAPTAPGAGGAQLVVPTTVTENGQPMPGADGWSNLTGSAAPTPPVLPASLAGATFTTGSPSFDISGVSAQATDVSVWVDGQRSSVTPPANASNGTVRVFVGKPLGDGTYQITVTQTVGGVESQQSAPATITIDNAGGNSTSTPNPSSSPAPPAPKSVTLSSHTVTPGHPVSVRFTAVDPGTVTLTLTTTKQVKLHGKTSTKTVVIGRVAVKVTKAGQKVSCQVGQKFDGHMLRKGSYRLNLQSLAGHSRSKTVGLAVKVA
jgi:hypothetical protein